MNRILLIAIALLCTIAAAAGPHNIAQTANVTSSGYKDGNSHPENIIDGKIKIFNKHEWASDAIMPYWEQLPFPWIKLEWDVEQKISKIILYDRPDLDSHIAGGDLLFSDGSKIGVLGIPNDGEPKVIEFDEKIVKWVEFRVNDAQGSYVGLSEMEVYPSYSQYTDYVSWVDPYIETTKGRYFFFITGRQPFGMIGAAPLTRNRNQYGGGYNYNSTEVLGFPQVHNWVVAGLTFMPTSGTVDPSLGEKNWKSDFTHDDEIVQPGYHRIYLKDYRIWVEQTATDRVSFYKLTYTEDMEAQLMFNLGGYLASTTMVNAKVKRISNTKIEGSFDTYGRHWGGPENIQIYFAAEFEKPFTSLDGWAGDEKYTDIDDFTGSDQLTRRNEKEAYSYLDSPPSGVRAHYTVKAGEELKVKMAISYVSAANAWENLRSECDHWAFDEVKESSRDEWNDWLGRIDVKGGTSAQRIKFYTDLWHTLMGRAKIDDVNGQYPDRTQGGERFYSYTLGVNPVTRTLPKGKDGKSLYHMYNSDAFWLTQWNLNILWGLAWPEVMDDISASLIQYADNGKLLPRGPAGGGYTYIMSGSPATNLIVSTYTKGLMTKVKPEHAFEKVFWNHQPGGMMGISDFYIEHGYQPGNAGMTLESAFQDWSLAQMAEGLGKKAEKQYLDKRSQGWDNLFNDSLKLIMPKDEQGNWIHKDPLEGAGWIEANAWQATWSVSHQLRKLSQLMGGDEEMSEKLNHAFEQSTQQDFIFGYSKGYVSYANQPGCSNAHVFSWAGKPWLTQYWVRRVKEQAYGAITPDNGYGGHDEDQGQMGGVSALMAIGLFDVRGTAALDPTYEITSPIFDEITIKLNSTYYPGKAFRIVTKNNAAENMYIQEATLNGKPLNNFWFRHADFVKGGILELSLGDKPNKQWGVGNYPD
ncbi:GH92 family glycosyl hydrolase [Parapedobacter pyrenivorans]|uniref:GH92 family glycosyl hydrolase n=1 Tax=Parapedobacter pyrenivorans TaxID=1305674 RepID=UPI00333F4B3C